MTTMHTALTRALNLNISAFGDTGLRQNEQVTQASLGLTIHIM